MLISKGAYRDHADYNREKDRATVETTFANLVTLVAGIDDETQRHVREGLTEEELAVFDLLLKDNISKADRERVKQASKGLLASLTERIASMPNWTKNPTTQAEVKTVIVDYLYTSLPRPPFTEAEADSLAERLYGFVFQQREHGSAMVA